MQKPDDMWLIVGTKDLPDWIIALEVELANAILNH
jgi:hypothetical protein